MTFNGLSPLQFSVREHIPLEQGLRLIGVPSSLSGYSVREHIPLEQGLRPLFYKFKCVTIDPVREHIPLEQGLRKKNLEMSALIVFESKFH